jgi:hypothetical protein
MMVAMPILALEEVHHAKPSDFAARIFPGLTPGGVWQTLLTKHCACSANTSRIAPSQKNAARPKYNPPKYESAKIAGCIGL